MGNSTWATRVGRSKAPARTAMVALVAEDSRAGRKAVELWVARFPDFAADAAAWQESGVGFLVNLRRASGESCASLVARDEAQLFRCALPALMQAISAGKGVCTNLLGVSAPLRYKLEQAFAIYGPMVNDEGSAFGVGYELFATGALLGRRLVHAKRRAHGRIVTVMVIDRTIKGASAIAMLRERSHTSWQQLQEWQYSGSGAFAVAVTDATRARLYCVPTIRGLLRQALPDALGPLIAAQTPTLMAMAVHVGLLRLIGDALVCLEHGALPVIDGFPLAPDSVGKAVSFRGLKIDNPRAFQDMLSLTAYGSGASSLGHEPLFEGHRQRGARALRQPDGSLHYIVDLENGDCLGTLVPAGGWRVQADDFGDAPLGRAQPRSYSLH